MEGDRFDSSYKPARDSEDLSMWSSNSSCWLVPLLWTVQIFYFSLLPRGSFPQVDQQHADAGSLQYVYHFGQFFCLSLLLYRAIICNSSTDNRSAICRHPASAAFALLVMIALLDEAIQIVVPTRHFTVRDLTADIVGGAVGLLLVQMIRGSRSTILPTRTLL